MTKAISGFFGEYRWLSNFWEQPFTYQGITCMSMEHAFQAAKTRDQQEFLHVLSAANPSVAKGRGRRVTLREDWEDIKVDVMRKLLRAKFSVPDLAQKLLETGNAELIEENTWNDTFWGVCRGVGENQLGKLLMEIRNELKGKA